MNGKIWQVAAIALSIFAAAVMCLELILVSFVAGDGYGPHERTDKYWFPAACLFGLWHVSNFCLYRKKLAAAALLMAPAIAFSIYLFRASVGVISGIWTGAQAIILLLICAGLLVSGHLQRE